MLLWPYLVVNGLLPYKDIAIAHTPHLLFDLAVFYKIFGIGIVQLKIYTWFLILVTDVLIFFIAKKIWNLKIALISVATFIFWQIFFDGNGLWFDSMLVPLSIFTFFLVQKRKYFWGGVLWACMLLTKQTAIWFLIPIFLTIFTKKDTKVFLKSFLIGVCLILILFILALSLFGILPSFIDWAIKFGIFVLPRATGQMQLPDIKNLAISMLPFSIFIVLFLKNKKYFLILISWTLAGCLGAYPRFEYFHIQPALPFLAIASGIVFTNIDNRNQLIKAFITFYIFGSLYLFTNYFMRNFNEGVRFYEQNVLDLAAYVKGNTQVGDKIFVVNWWDNIYPLTDTIPATDPWVPQLSWYQELPSVQDIEIQNLEKTKPKLILLQNYSDSGLSSYKPLKVYDYLMKNYKLKEKVDGIEILVPNKI